MVVIINYWMILRRASEVLDCPVVSKSMLIYPVVGSVAAYCIAFLIRRVASSKSHFSTFLDSLIFALASESLIMDSSYLGVAVIVFVVFPSALILTYSLTKSN